MIVFRCDGKGCKTEAPASTKSGALPRLWTIGLGVDLCPKCSGNRLRPWHHPQPMDGRAPCDA